jgi:hypothetical protein
MKFGTHSGKMSYSFFILRTGSSRYLKNHDYRLLEMFTLSKQMGDIVISQEC